MGEWALPAIAVLLIAYGAVSARLRSTVVTQALPVADQRTRGSDADRATEEPREHGRTT